MKPSIKPLGIAQKVSLRIDDTGLVCFQYMIKIEDSQHCYIDFYVSSLFEVFHLIPYIRYPIFSNVFLVPSGRRLRGRRVMAFRAVGKATLPNETP